MRVCDRWGARYPDRRVTSDAYDSLVVGAGFAGAIMAERLASQCGHRVLIIDRRDHIARQLPPRCVPTAAGHPLR